VPDNPTNSKPGTQYEEPLGTPLSTSRVVTQNLVISASQAEIEKEVWQSSVHDLSTLINLVALYDDVFVLGRAAEFNAFRNHSDLMRFLADENIVKTQVLNEQARDDISRIAKKHLAFYLEKDEVERFEPLLRFAISPTEALYGLLYFSDSVEQARIGDLWLRTVPDNVDLIKALEGEIQTARGGTFFVRSFLYLAYSDYLRIPFTSDRARSVVVQKVLKKEDTFFRTRVLDKLQESYETYPALSAGDYDYRKIVSPFAAVVFDRCNGKRSRLVKEVERIREELEPTRERLRALEWHARWGTRTESIKAEGKIQEILAEIARQFGPRPGLLKREKGISFRGDIAEIADNPTSWKAWLTAISSLPAEVATRLAHQRPVAELHYLQRELPGPGTLNKALDDLFGTLRS
jgi:hypothetical protein